MDRGRETADFGGVTLDGRYRLGDRRGDGAHDGVHLPTGRRVVVRQCPGDTTSAMRLKRTLHRVVALEHPAVIPILDAGASEVGLYLVEARVEGESLAELLDQPQPADRVADIVRQLAMVLAEAHGRGLFHGALRPEDVILQQTTGRSDFVRLSGLGLSDTPFGAGAGPWTAPELREGQPADARSDLFTMGLIGRALLGGFTPAEAVARPVPGAPPRLMEVLDAVCRRSPAQRPPSAVAVLGPLERATSVGQLGGRAMGDAFISTGPLPDAQLILGGPPAPESKPIDAPPEHLPPPRRAPWIWVALVVILVGVIVALLLGDDPPPAVEPQPAAAASTAPAPDAAPTPAPDAAPAPEPDAAAPDAAAPEPDAAVPDAAAPEPDAARRKAVRRDRPADKPRARPRPRPDKPAPTPPGPADYEKL